MSFVFYLIRYEFKKPEQQLNKKGSILYNALNVAKMNAFCLHQNYICGAWNRR